MRHYPVFLNFKNKKALVFGAGKVATRKIKSLLQAGAKVDVISLEFADEIKQLAKGNRNIRLIPNGSLNTTKLKEADLVFAATSDKKLNQQIANLCRRQRILVNVADHPKLSDFFVPSYIKKGLLEIAISTGGASPALAKRFRQELESKIKPEAVKVIKKMKAVRDKALREMDSQIKRQKFFEEHIGKQFEMLEQVQGKGNGLLL